MKKLVRFLLVILGSLVLGGFTVRASEGMEITGNILLEITQEAMLMAEPDEQSEVIATLAAGTPVFSVEDSDGIWIKISYQELSGYTHLQNVRIYGSEELDQEFEQQATQNVLLINELEYIAAQKKQKTTWTIVIAVLVVAIFAVSIASAVLKNIHEMDKRRNSTLKRRKRR